MHVCRALDLLSRTLDLSSRALEILFDAFALSFEELSIITFISYAGLRYYFIHYILFTLIISWKGIVKQFLVNTCSHVFIRSGESILNEDKVQGQYNLIRSIKNALTDDKEFWLKLDTDSLRDKNIMIYSVISRLLPLVSFRYKKFTILRIDDL